MSTLVKPKNATTFEVASKLVKLCRAGKNVEAIKELYDDRIVSIEPKGSRAEKTEGKTTVQGKTTQWLDMVEKIHSSKISDPLVSDNYFSVVMDTDVTLKGKGRSTMKELAVYEVKEGKIIKENFFYHPTN
jgi:hypothetical protein